MKRRDSANSLTHFHRMYESEAKEKNRWCRKMSGKLASTTVANRAKTSRSQSNEHDDQMVHYLKEVSVFRAGSAPCLL